MICIPEDAMDTPGITAPNRDALLLCCPTWRAH